MTSEPANGSKKDGGSEQLQHPGERALEILGGELIYTKSINIIAICFSCQVAHRSQESLVPAHTLLTRKISAYRARGMELSYELVARK